MAQVFIDAELSFIVFIIENKNIKTRFSSSSIFSIASHKKILILRYTIVVLPNAFWGSTQASQLQNSRWARNYYMVVTPRLCSVNNFQLNTCFVALLFVYGSKTLNLFRYKLLTTSLRRACLFGANLLLETSFIQNLFLNQISLILQTTPPSGGGLSLRSQPAPRD